MFLKVCGVSIESANDRVDDPTAYENGPNESLARKGRWSTEACCFREGSEIFAMKDDDHELPNVLTECAGFGSLPLRRGCARVRRRESERRPARRHDAEVRSNLR